MVAPRILVVDDDAAVRLDIIAALHLEGYASWEASRGDSGLEMALCAACDLLLLSLILPGRSGLDVLEQVRAARPDLPVILLSDRSCEAARLRGLQLGAAECVRKPFSPEDLLLRVGSVLRGVPLHSRMRSQILLQQGRAHLDRREVRFEDGGCAEMSERECQLLRYLAEHAGRAVSRDELMQRVWHLNPQGRQTRTIDMHIARLREKLRDDSSRPHLIRTVRGQGYMLVLSEE